MTAAGTTRWARKAATGVLATTALVVLAGSSIPVGPPDSAEAHSVVQSSEIRLLPPISQVGRHVASSSRARTVISVAFHPVTPGRPVVLSRLSGDTWLSVDTTQTSPQGRAEFSVPTRWHGAPVTYRAQALDFRSLPAATTEAVLSTTWGDPDFVDEFSGPGLGDTWHHRIQFYNPWGGRNCARGSPEAVRVAHGALRLSVLDDPRRHRRCTALDTQGRPLGRFAYRLNANISSEGSADFRYGVAAARMRFQRRPGQHAAFWLQPRGLLATGPTPWGAEIDVVEWYGAHGRRDRLATAVHRPTSSGELRLTQVGGAVDGADGFLAGATDRWWRNFHVFSVEWTPREYVFRIDGRETWRTDEGVSQVPEFLILSMLSNDFELADLGSDDHLPQHADVDWVGFWRAG